MQGMMKSLLQMHTPYMILRKAMCRFCYGFVVSLWSLFLFLLPLPSCLCLRNCCFMTFIRALLISRPKLGAPFSDVCTVVAFPFPFYFQFPWAEHTATQAEETKAYFVWFLTDLSFVHRLPQGHNKVLPWWELTQIHHTVHITKTHTYKNKNHKINYS